MRAADDAGDGLRTCVVGDDGHVGCERVGLAVERRDGLAVFRKPRMDVPLHRVGVEDMQGPAIGEGDVVRHVHQGRDRAKADGLEPALQPFGRRAVLHAADVTPDEERTGSCVSGREVERDLDGRLESAGDRRGLQRLQLAQALGGEIARDAIDAQRVGPVGRHLHIDHRIVEAQGHGGGGAHRPVAGELDDAVVLVRNQQLAFGTQHGLRFDAADAGRREDRAGRREYVRRAAR